MTFMRRPRVFLSYRHEEQATGLSAEAYNAQHRAWVNDFAHALGSWYVDVIWDDRLRDLFRPHTSTDPGILPFLAEVSTLCVQVSQTFMPILTRGYVERIAGGGGGSGHGTVSEEWSHGIVACKAGSAELVAIIREWPIPGIDRPPAPITPDSAWDFRFVAPVVDEVELICDRLHGLWDVERPQADMPFAELISRYLKFCVSAFELPWPGIEKWGCNFTRPHIFLEFSELATSKSSRHRDVGSQRDMNEVGNVLASGIFTGPEGAASPPPMDPDKDREAEEAAKLLMRNVFAAHIGKNHEPFAFDQQAPGGRASDGLYFGPTQPGFSFLHAMDPRHPRNR